MGWNEEHQLVVYVCIANASTQEGWLLINRQDHGYHTIAQSSV
jgi:hypothetical protein